MVASVVAWLSTSFNRLRPRPQILVPYCTNLGWNKTQRQQYVPVNDFFVIYLWYVVFLYTGWLNLTAPLFLRRPMSTLFLRDRPWNFAHVFDVPLPNLSRFFFPPARYLGFCIFLGIWVLRGPTFPAKTKNKNIREGLGRGTLNTCNFSGSYLSKTAWTFGLLCGKVPKPRLRIENYLVSV